MNTNDERDQFLAAQARRFGEEIQVFALARVLSGPPLGADMVLLLVGASALHLLPSVQDASMFGIALPSKKKAPEPTALSFPQARVTSFAVVKPIGWWKALTAPPEVVTVSAQNEGQPSVWQFQLVGGAQAFVTTWQKTWNLTLSP